MFKLDSEKAEEPEIKLPTSIGSHEKQENSRKTSTSASLTTLNPLYAEYIMRNAGLDEAEAGIQITGRNINILRCAGDTTLMAESKEELKSLLMKVKEESEKLG